MKSKKTVFITLQFLWILSSAQLYSMDDASQEVVRSLSNTPVANPSIFDADFSGLSFGTEMLRSKDFNQVGPYLNRCQRYPSYLCALINEGRQRAAAWHQLIDLHSTDYFLPEAMRSIIFQALSGERYKGIITDSYKSSLEQIRDNIKPFHKKIADSCSEIAKKLYRDADNANIRTRFGLSKSSSLDLISHPGYVETIIPMLNNHINLMTKSMDEDKNELINIIQSFEFRIE